MDKLDKVSILFILAFISAIAVVSVDYRSESGARINRPSTHPLNITETEGISEDGIKTIKNLVETGSLQKAETLLNELVEKHPYEGELHMLMGDVMMRKQDAINALYHYKGALDLNPDYLDKKTPLFQGRKIKIAVEEAKAKINEILSATPDDAKTKEAKKTMYYMMKKLAGSCG